MSPSLRTVILLNDFCYANGGASKSAIDTARGLAEAGIAVKYLGGVGPVSAELRHPNLDVTCLNQPELIQFTSQPQVALQGLWNLEAARAMRGLLAACEPRNSVVHVHGWGKALSTAPVRAALQAGFPTLLTLHDFFAACPNGAFYDYQQQRCCERRALSTECLLAQCDKRGYAHKGYRLVRSAVQTWAGHFPRDIRHFTAASQRTEKLMRPYLGTQARVFPLENMIAVEQAPAVSAASNSKLVAVGRLDPEKGVELLVAAAAAAGVNITFIGDGRLRPWVTQHAHCEVTGWVEPETVQNLLRSARALIFPSLWYETYGLVVSEAAAVGVPSIVSDVSAAAERVLHGETGWVFESGNVAALTHQLRQLQDDATVERVGQAAYARYWQNAPSQQRYISELLHILHTVLADHAAGPELRSAP